MYLAFSLSQAKPSHNIIIDHEFFFAFISFRNQGIKTSMTSGLQISRKGGPSSKGMI
jgi:hypothetical protein